jgi:hypothetical protein
MHLYAGNRTAHATVTVDVGDWPVDVAELSNKRLVAVVVGIGQAKDAHLEDLGLQPIQRSLQLAEKRREIS